MTVKTEYCDGSIFTDFLTDETPRFEVSLSEDYIEKACRYYPNMPKKHVEQNELQFAVSHALHSCSVCEFHCVALKWRGRALLFAAPSGVGKTTQYLRWKECFGDEIEIISGDKVFLSFADEIKVFASPWRGKERFGNNISAPLGYVIFLNQAPENSISAVEPKEVALTAFKQFVFLLESPEEAKLIALFAERLLTFNPIFLLKNRGDTESARLTHAFLEKEDKNG